MTTHKTKIERRGLKMKKNRILWSVVVAVFVVCSGMSAWATESDIELEGYKLINEYWNMLEAKYVLEAYPFKSPEIGDLERDYVVKARTYRNSTEELARVISSKMKDGDVDMFNSFSSFYKTHERFLKRALDPAVKSLVDRIQSDSINDSGSMIRCIPEKYRSNITQEYFPGYGYADPKYIYRKGTEVRRELMHAYWKTEQETIQTTNYMEMTIAVELMASLEAQVDFLKILKLFEIEINGKIVAAAKVSFQVSKTLVTTCQRKYERNKVWFELYHAKKDYFWEPQWEKCGETYEFFEEPTGEEVVIGSEIQDPPPIPPADNNDGEYDDEYTRRFTW